MKPVIRCLAILGLVTVIFASASAHACQGPQFESHIFTPVIPADKQDAEFIGNVEVKSKWRWLLRLPGEVHGYYLLVHESSTHPDLVGSKINMLAMLGTSCGPFIQPGDRGNITGQVYDDNASRITVSPDAYSGKDIFRALREQ